MRLNRLELVRYGKFTGRTLDFGRSSSGQADLHIVYGPNEAGKSTLFSAFLDFLFGIEHSSGYGFLHPYPTMRVGGEIAADGRLHHAYRVKRKQNSLIGPDEQPLPDNLFSAALGAIDRATYQMMFSLDDDSIERGGEGILNSEGELGALLFSASSGLPDSSAVLSALKSEADAFYKPQGRKHHLGELKAELDVLKDRKAEIDTNARAFTMLRKARDLAVERHKAASDTRAATRLALDFARDKIGGLDLLHRLQALRGDLAACPAAADPPSDWHGLLPHLMQREATLSTRHQQLDAELERRSDELDGIARDDAVLAAADAIERIDADDLEARYKTAARDMPARLEERQAVEREIASCLHRLGQDATPDPTALLLPAAVTGRIQELSQQHSGLVERLSGALHEATTAQREAAEAQAQIDALPEGGTEQDTQPLAALIQRLHQDDCRVRETAARRRIVALEGTLADAMAGLAPFAGTTDDLLAEDVVTQTETADWTRRASVLQEQRQRTAERIAEERVLLAGEQARFDELARLGGFVADDTALVLRANRDQAWEAHLRRLDLETARRFEETLKQDDAAAALRLAQSERLAEARGLALSLAGRQARLDALEAQAGPDAAAMDSLSTERRRLCARCGLPETMGIVQLESWLLRRRAALETRAALRGAEQEMILARADAEGALERLHRQLSGLGVVGDLPAHLDDALSFAGQWLDKVQTLRGRRLAAEDGGRRATTALQSREAARHTAEAAMEAWRTDWAAAIGGTWLARTGAMQTPGAVVPVLTGLQDLDRHLRAGAALDHRIEAMRRDQAHFRTSVAALCILLGMPVGTENAMAVFLGARARLGRARESENLRKRLSGDIEATQADRRTLGEDLARHEAQKRAMLDFFDCDTLAQVGERLEAVKVRDRLRERIAETGRDLCARLSVADTDAAELVLAAVDAAELSRDVVVLEARLEECDREAADTHAERRETEKALAAIAGDDRAAHLEEQRRTTLLDIEDKALTYLRLRAGILATEQALRLYRERHRSAMMQRASTAFSRISGGDYAGLSTQLDKGEEFLIANAAGGGSKLARDLSKGTRFQLYLALRMAGYHEIAATRESLPFIADDIMETFDDDRAFHAFGLMAEMATVGQVIYLTHHRHLCDIAHKACPDATIHML